MFILSMNEIWFKYMLEKCVYERNKESFLDFSCDFPPRVPGEKKRGHSACAILHCYEAQTFL